MLHSLETLRAEVQYHQRDLLADAARDRLGRGVRTRRFRWLTGRDAERLRSDVAELIVAARAPDSARPDSCAFAIRPQWSPEPTPPHGAEVR